ncbi:MAG TPA: hypothetical protein DIT32_00685 [Peptococcaceae bacterium]|nr:hypothetical protein [Peptococcaceae bacterium]
MKKVFALFLVFALVFSVSFTALALPGSSVGKGAGEAKVAREKVVIQKAENLQKVFKAELNAQKKELQKQKSALCQQLELLEAQYAALTAVVETTTDATAETPVDAAAETTDEVVVETVDAAALLESINSLKAQIAGLNSEIKQTINERFMIVKTMYSNEELAQFENAAAVIEQMKEGATILSASCVTVNNNIVKFDAPAYMKGGVTMVPFRAIAEQLGAEVTWNEETQTVNVVREGAVIEIKGTTILLNGAPFVINTEVTCGRTYMPLRFLAEALGLEVAWDGDNEIIDIDDEVGEEVVEDTTDGTVDDGTSDAPIEDPGTDAAEEPAAQI